EVLELRARGLDVHVATINPPDRRPEQLTAAERGEAARVHVIKQTPRIRIAAAVLRTAVQHPAGLLRALGLALRLGRGAPGATLYNLFYLVEAILVGRWMAAQGLDHLHVHFATPAATVGLLASRLFPITFSITVHGPDEFYDAPGFHLAE